MMPRVVVTGAGVIAPIGTGLPEFGSALWSGATGVKAGTRFPQSPAAELGDFNPQPWLGNKGVRVLDRGTRLLCIAAQMALHSTGLLQDPESLGDAELGLVCGTLFGGVHSIASFDWSGLTEGPSYVSPMDFPNTVINAPAGQAAIKHKLRGVNSTVCSGLSSGLTAIQYAADFLRFGRARYLTAGGMEEVCEEAVLGFNKLKINSESGSVRPFGADRDGTVPGEGAALWMLETEATALARGAQPVLEICGFGAAQDASMTADFHLRPEAPIFAIRQALEYSGIGPDQIACIVASANGSRLGDEMEAKALCQVFGQRLSEVPVSAPKASTGEAMGASGALCALAAGLALQRQEAPPTANFRETETGLRLSARPQPFQGQYALVNAFGCEGNHASLVIRLWKS